MEEGPLKGGENNIHEFFTKLLVERDDRIKLLEKALAEAQKQTHQPAAVKDDWEERFEKLYADYERLKSENQVEINGYKSRINGLTATLESIRNDKPQAAAVPPATSTAMEDEKGGRQLDWAIGLFGLLLGTALGAFIGMSAQKRFMTPKNEQTRVFEQFQKKHQFNFEYEIAHGRFSAIDSALRTEINAPENLTIKPELEFLQQTLKAARIKMVESKVPMSDEGFAIMPNTEIVVKDKSRQRITITEPTLSVRSEASTTSDKLGTLKKDDVVKVMDNSHRLDKLTTRYEGKRAEIEDVWYKIEMPDGVEGWVFGYYTSASRNAITVFDDSGTGTTTTAPTTATPGTKPVTPATKPAAPASKDTIKVIVPAQKKQNE